MGGCIGSTSRHATLRDNFDVEPSDTATMSPEGFPLLNFKALLTKLKIKWCKGYVLFKI